MTDIIEMNDSDLLDYADENAKLGLVKIGYIDKHGNEVEFKGSSSYEYSLFDEEVPVPVTKDDRSVIIYDIGIDNYRVLKKGSINYVEPLEVIRYIDKAHARRLYGREHFNEFELY